MSDEESRPRGIIVYPMPEEVGGPVVYGRYALLIGGVGEVDTSEVRMVHTEGVGYKVTDEKPWVWTDYDPEAPKFTPVELLDIAGMIEGVDLADWVRTFGARLESNFYQLYVWATKGM